MCKPKLQFSSQLLRSVDVRKSQGVSGGWEKPSSLEPFLSRSASALLPGHPLLLTKSPRSTLVVRQM